MIPEQPMMTKIVPFANERDTTEIDGLIIENRIDRISVYGSVDITRDKTGLGRARELVSVLRSVLEKLESEELPDSLPPPQGIDTIENPFE